MASSSVAATLLATGSLPSAAQIKLDMNRITCKGWLRYSPEDRDFVRFFMSGYYNAAASRNVLDYDRLQKNSAKVTAYCKRHGSDTLPTAISKVASSEFLAASMIWTKGRSTNALTGRLDQPPDCKLLADVPVLHCPLVRDVNTCCTCHAVACLKAAPRT